MKSAAVGYDWELTKIALYMSAWIEIKTLASKFTYLNIALYMSAWIEIVNVLI
ncbi:hypothetical protein [Alkalicoccobacillus plakortidis]|uniref:hypothetical protein n=1 Tax=Shouchella oshimensis TaxID=290588 RepID=UPI0013649574|nr:hypothetical protein [Alkalicoccobacillus plakortidis]